MCDGRVHVVFFFLGCYRELKLVSVFNLQNLVSRWRPPSVFIETGVYPENSNVDPVEHYREDSAGVGVCLRGTW